MNKAYTRTPAAGRPFHIHADRDSAHFCLSVDQLSY